MHANKARQECELYVFGMSGDASSSPGIGEGSRRVEARAFSTEEYGCGQKGWSEPVPTKVWLML